MKKRSVPRRLRLLDVAAVGAHLRAPAEPLAPLPVLLDLVGEGRFDLRQ